MTVEEQSCDNLWRSVEILGYIASERCNERLRYHLSLNKDCCVLLVIPKSSLKKAL